VGQGLFAMGAVAAAVVKKVKTVTLLQRAKCDIVAL
jgi:hypothetical protein